MNGKFFALSVEAMIIFNAKKFTSVDLSYKDVILF